MSVPTGYLHPTPNRLALLAQIANFQVLTDITADGDRIVLAQDAPTSWQNQTTVTASVREMEAAGWVEQHPNGVDWRPTAYGWAMATLRWCDFGPDAHIQMSAEIGDPDDPRIVGIVQHLPPQPNRGPRWAVTLTVNDETELCRTRLYAAAELRHRACLLLAAEEEATLAAATERTAARVAAAAADTPAGMVHACQTNDMVEHEMSTCPYGCKIYRCRQCGARELIHLAVYGCPTGRQPAPDAGQPEPELAPRQCGEPR